jgi:hypothetical protein
MLLFGLYFVFPYWTFPTSPRARWSFFAVVVLAFPLWAFCLGPLVRHRGGKRWFGARDGTVLGIFFVALLIVQFRFLTLPLAWKGDEEFHVLRTILIHDHYASLLVEKFPLLLLCMAGGAIAGFILSRRLGRWSYGAAMIFAVLIFFAAAFGSGGGETSAELRYWLVRYPPFLIIPEVLLANKFLGTFFLEFFHRLPSFLSFFFVAVLAYGAFRRAGFRPAESTAVPLILLSCPLAFFYSTLAYIEPLLVLWQSLILYSIIESEPDDIGLCYRIACITAFGGLIKETTVPFLGAVFLWLAMRAIRFPETTWLRKAAHAARFAVIIFLPAVPYFYLRMGAGERGHAMLFANLFQVKVYERYLYALIHFFTLALALVALAGLLLMLLKKKHRGPALLALFSVIAYFLFFSADQPAFIGYSRFMLHFFPLVFAGIYGFFRLQREFALSRFPSWKIRHYAVAGLLVLANLVMAPLTISSRALWVEPAEEAEKREPAEAFYPYRDAIKHMAEEYGAEYPFVLFGLPYPYRFLGFYQRRYDARNRLLGTLKTNDPGPIVAHCRRQGIKKCLLLHHLPMESAGERKFPNLRFVKRFELGPGRLDLYELAPP